MKIVGWLTPLAIASVCSVVSLQPASANVDYIYPAGIVTGDVVDATIGSSTYDGLSPGQISLVGMGGTVAVGWCYDITTSVKVLGSYTVAPASGLTNQGAIGALVHNGNALLASAGATWNNYNIATDGNVSEGIQLAIWSEEYSGISFTGVNSVATGYMNTYLGYVTSGPWVSEPNFSLLSQANNQALVAAIPEPSTWMMALIGFAALGVVGLRRVSRPAAARA